MEKKADQLTDQELVKLAKEDMKHFEQLYRKYYSQIFKFVHKRVANTNLVNDITSQVFLKAMVNLKGYTYQGFPFSSWLYRIALSELGNMFRAEKAERALKVDWALHTSVLDELTDGSNKPSLEELAQALNDLNDTQLQMVEMRYFEKMKLKEIAVVLELSESNAKVKMHRTLVKLKKHLGYE